MHYGIQKTVGRYKNLDKGYSFLYRLRLVKPSCTNSHFHLLPYLPIEPQRHRSKPLCQNRLMAGELESRMNFTIEQRAQFAFNTQALVGRQMEGQRLIVEMSEMTRQVVPPTYSSRRSSW